MIVENRLQKFALLSSFLISSLAIPLEAHDGRSVEIPASIKLRTEVVYKTFTPKEGSGNTASTDFKALQMNLCNSGFAGCYQNGLAVGEGSSAISLIEPDVVTVNEICLEDVSKQLHPTFASAWPKDYTYYVFEPAIDKRTNAGYKCKNGDLYGDAVIGRVAAANWKGFKAYGGIYTAQDGGNEQRTFACAAAVGDHFACTTHLATAPATALTQCKALAFEAIPYLKGISGASGYTIIGGDLNLKYDTSSPQNVQACVPNGYTRKGDSSVQHITFSNDFKFDSSSKVSIPYTDHVGWMVDLTRT